MKYLIVTDEDENGDRQVQISQGNTPEKAFEKWFLDEYHGCEWDDLDFGGKFPLRETFSQVYIYPIQDKPTKLNYAKFIDKHDKRTEVEKDPEYKTYMKLKNKFKEV